MGRCDLWLERTNDEIQLIRLVYILLLVLSFPVLADTHIVCSDCHIGKVRNAVDMSERGDTIIIKSGVYKESLIEIDKPLTIIGENFPKIVAKVVRKYSI